MSAPSDPAAKPARRIPNHAAAAEARDLLVRQLLEKERAALDAKTLKLRALRLAREEEKRAEASKQAEAFLAAMQRKAKSPAADTLPAKRAAKPSRSAVNQKKNPAAAKSPR